MQENSLIMCFKIPGRAVVLPEPCGKTAWDPTSVPRRLGVKSFRSFELKKKIKIKGVNQEIWGYIRVSRSASSYIWFGSHTCNEQTFPWKIVLYDNSSRMKVVTRNIKVWKVIPTATDIWEHPGLSRDIDRGKHMSQLGLEPRRDRQEE